MMRVHSPPCVPDLPPPPSEPVRSSVTLFDWVCNCTNSLYALSQYYLPQPHFQRGNTVAKHPSDLEKGKRAYHKFTNVEKAKTVVYWLEQGKDFAKAAEVLKADWIPSPKDFPPHTVTYAPGWLDVLLETGALDGKRRTGPEHKVPLEEARDAATQLMDGSVVTVLQPGKEPKQARIRFTSIARAREYLPILNHLIDKYEVTEETLMDRMKEARPDLVYALQRVKYNLSDAHKRERQTTATALAGAPPSFLKTVVWVDETKIIVLGDNPKDVHVWRSKECADADCVIHIGGFGSKPVKICLYAAVNAELGLVAYQFTTGTTGLGVTWPRARFPGINDIDWDGVKYKVRMLHIKCPYASVCANLMHSILKGLQYVVHKVPGIIHTA